jgi:hypothetical protein
VKTPLFLLITAIGLSTFTQAQQATDSELSGARTQSRAELALPDALARQAALAILPARGLLLIPDSRNNRVMAFDPDTGALVDSNFVPPDAVNLSTPINALLSPDFTRIYISDQVNDLIQQYSLASGAYLGALAPVGGLNPAILDNNRGMGYASNGDLLVTVGAGGNINAVARFNSVTGVQLTPLSASNAIAGFTSPFDVFRIPRDAPPLLAGEYLVSSSNSGKIVRLSATGQFIADFAIAGSFAQQIAQARNGNILVAGFGVNADGVFEFTPTGQQISRLDNATTGGYRGVYELANGNVLTTTGAGVFELDRSTGALERIVVSDVQGRYIEFVQAVGPDLALTQAFSRTQIGIGETLTLSLEVRNPDPALAAAGVQVASSIAFPLAFQNSNCGAAQQGNSLVWTIGALPAQSRIVCVITLSGAGIGSTVISSTLISTSNDVNLTNNSAAQNVVVAAIQLPFANRISLSILAGLLTLIGSMWLFARKD